MKILHIISNLSQGGAEAVLSRLIMSSPTDTIHVVVSLMGDSYYGPRLRAAHVRVHTLDNPRGRMTFASVLKLRGIIVAEAPDAVQTWMYHADLVGGLIARLTGIKKIFWNIRHSNFDFAESSFATRLVARACAKLSRIIPNVIVCCSEQAAMVHQEFGYRKDKFIVIPNGYDLARFSQDDSGRALVRAEWGVSDNEILLGLVARWNSQKDHSNLLHALAILNVTNNNLRCVMVGAGMGPDNIAMTDLIRLLGLSDKIILAGPRDDIPRVMNALDLHVLPSSHGEAFPNVVAEAMACGTSCVVTDVGDAALIVGETGWVVPPQNTKALAQGIEDALAALRKDGRAILGRICRARIEQNFSLDKMISGYRTTWQSVFPDVV
ncbi:MAG: glycosyltransferase family 4 protein [Bacteroidota bacterium]